MSNIIIQGNEINAKKYVEKITIEGVGEEKTLNPRMIVAKGGEEELNEYIFNGDDVKRNYSDHSGINYIYSYDIPNYFSTQRQDISNLGSQILLNKISNDYYLYLGDNSSITNRLYCFAHKIVKNRKKICVNTYSTIYTTSDSARWYRVYLLPDIGPSLVINQFGDPSPYKKAYHICNSGMTVQQINSQEGISINVTANDHIDRQTIEIDISGYDEDLWFSIWTYNQRVYINSIKIE